MAIDFNDSEPIDDSIIVPNKSEQTIPDMFSPKWSDYVMSHFEPNELDDKGRPKTEGLLRVATKLLGPILGGKATVKQCPSPDNDQRATVEYTTKILMTRGYEEPYVVEFTDAADAYADNIPDIKFAIYPTAMATTRAMGRALRRALHLSIVTSEEVSDQPVDEGGLHGRISNSQITKIDTKCEQLDINILEFINSGKTKYKNIRDVSATTAVEMFKRINEYQRGEKQIPDRLRGYNSSWRDNT